MQKKSTKKTKIPLLSPNNFIYRIKALVKRIEKGLNTDITGSNCELTRYINKIFEQQEKERIVRWLVNSIRESLELDTVLENTVKEVGSLLKVDRCLIALYEKQDKKFYFRSEYRKKENISSLINEEKPVCKIPFDWQSFLIKNNLPICIDNPEKKKLKPEEKYYFRHNKIKSLIIIPIVFKEGFLGILMVHQTEYPRKWTDDHFDVLKDIGSQISIAINQAILYSKIQEATRLKNDFLAGMSHELRTPLNAVIGFSEMLLSENFGKINEKQRKFLTNISVSGEHLLRLVNDLLDLSKIESGNMEIHYENFNVHTAIKETVSVLNSLAVQKNVNIEADIPPDLSINADLRKFKQIMYNLLSNSVKFTREGGMVYVKAFQEDENLKVEVLDNGIGISPGDKDKIFKRFRQLDSSLTRKQEGTGLGLTLTKKLIELHSGVIDFESEIDKGSKFWFILPWAKGVSSLNPDSECVYKSEFTTGTDFQTFE